MTLKGVQDPKNPVDSLLSVVIWRSVEQFSVFSSEGWSSFFETAPFPPQSFQE